MNPKNYASLYESKKLVEAGIVIETDVYHRVESGLSILQSKTDMKIASDQYHPDADPDVLSGKAHFIPAPSMAEVWRELPVDADLQKRETNDCAWIAGTFGKSPIIHNTNPTDALVVLLIWVRK